MAEVFTPDVLILIAAALYTLGYLVINQMILRIMLFAGSAAYIAYYATVADAPLWSAIYSSLLMMGANLIGMAGLMLRNMKFAVPRSHADLYADFAPLRPGEFRALMRLANRHVMAEETTLTTEGQTVPSIYYVISGVPVVTKLGTSFPMAERIFVGEVAYLNNGPSAATTVVPAGAEILEWRLSDLRTAARRKPQIKLALDAVISRDLARKVALAVAPAARQLAQEAETGGVSAAQPA